MDLAWGDEDVESILLIEYPHFGTLDSSVCVLWSLLFLRAHFSMDLVVQDKN